MGVVLHDHNGPISDCSHFELKLLPRLVLEVSDGDKSPPRLPPRSRASSHGEKTSKTQMVSDSFGERERNNWPVLGSKKLSRPADATTPTYGCKLPANTL